MTRIVILGASGLTGSHLLEQLSSHQELSLFPLGRRILPQWRKWPNTRPIIMPLLHQVQDYADSLDADILVHCLGTTRAHAGSAKAFRQLDLEIPQAIFAQARARGCEHLILLSSIGAHSGSKALYTKTKGELEDYARSLGFSRLDIIQPSLLLGPRKKFRPGEWLMQKICGPLAPLFPLAYRPIKATELARYMAKLCLLKTPGVFVHSNRDLHL